MSAASIHPTPVPLPANLPADSYILSIAVFCPQCETRLVHAHCDSRVCPALVCVACDLVLRPTNGLRPETWFVRDKHTEPEKRSA